MHTLNAWVCAEQTLQRSKHEQHAEAGQDKPAKPGHAMMNRMKPVVAGTVCLRQSLALYIEVPPGSTQWTLFTCFHKSHLPMP